MAQTIKLKRSGTSGATPTTSQLELGEVAINTYDGKMYIKKNVGGTESIVEVGGLSSVSLGGLSDVTISSVAADQLLQYNGSEWVNVSIAEASAIMKEYQFTATAGQSTFSGSDDNSETLSYTAGAIQVFLNGIFLDSAVDYTATNGTSVVLSETVDANDYLQVVAFKKKIGDGNVSVNTFTGNGSTTAFTLSVDPGDENNTRVFVDGVYQSKSNYSVSGTTLTFSTAPPADTAVEVEIGNRVVTLDTLSDLDLPDDVKLRLGTSQDLQIYHDSSTNSSIIKETGAGNLELWGNNVKIMNVAGTETQLNANPNGQVELYYDNSKKLETTNDGVTVTGDVEADEFIGDLRGAVLFKAQAGESLSKGDVVYISGISGNTTIVSKADADDANKMPAFGIAAAAASANNPVDVYTGGILSGIDTSSFSEGDELFVSTTAGVLTATPPTGESAALQKIGKVTRSASSGSIFIVGAGRSNAVPNLDDGDIFIGNASNQAVSASLNAKIEDYLDGGTSTPTFAGLATTANMTFGDSDRAIFGAGSDLQIYHDGSNSYIGEFGTGSLRIRSNQVRLEAPDSQNMVIVTEDAGVQAFYNGTQRFQVTNTGINVTGSVTADSAVIDSITIDGTEIDSSSSLMLDIAGNLTVNVDGTTVTLADDTINFGQFYNNASGQFNIYAPTQDKDIVFLGNDGGSTITALTLDMSAAGAATFNAGSTFSGNLAITAGSGQRYIEIASGTSNAKTYRIYNGISWNPDALLIYNHTDDNTVLTIEPGKLGVNRGANSLSHTLDVGGNIAISGTEIVTTSRTITNIGSLTVTGTNANLTLGSSGNNITFGRNGDNYIDAQAGTSSNIVINPENRFVVNTSDTERMRIDSSGNVGIGVNNPGSYYAFANNLVVGGDSANRAGISIAGSTTGMLNFTDGTGLVGFIEYNHTSDSLSMGTAATTALSINAQQKVGIGTTVPNRSDFNIHGANRTLASTTSQVAITASDSIAADIGGSLHFGARYDTTTTDFAPTGYVAGRRENATVNNYAGYLQFGVTQGNAGTIEAMRITSTGNVGIGTDSPNAMVHAKNTTSAAQIKISDSTNTAELQVASNGFYLNNPVSAGTFIFRNGTGYTERMRIGSSGNVGIGTTNPDSKLHISGAGNTNIKITAGANSSASLRLVNDAHDWDVNCQTTDKFAIYSHTAGTARLVIDTSGNVGIGTTSPFAKSHIVDTGWSSGAPYGTVQLIEGNDVNDNNWGHLVVTDTSTANGNGGAISFATGASTALNPFSGIKGISEGTSYGGLGLFTRANGGTATERMRITSTGRVRINNNNSSWDALGTLLVKQASNNVGIGIVDQNSTNTFQIRNNGTYSEFYYNVNNPIVFSQSGGERMRIDSSGNLLVAKTSLNDNLAGFQTSPSGETRITRSGGLTLVLNRKTSDGEILGFRKDGTVVGGIGASNSDITISSRSDVGIKIFAPSTDGTSSVIHAMKPTANSAIDAKMDLGYTGGRFKDLHLSGTSYTNQVELAEISTSISQTAYDIFVYDTRNDSDGGAWRYRTQHTSWYNETLNTSTRGSRREFPAVAVLVTTESGTLSIYDADDPDLPLWMSITPLNINQARVVALNGVILFGNRYAANAGFGGNGFIYYNFAGDYSRHGLSNGSDPSYIPEINSVPSGNMSTYWPKRPNSGARYYTLSDYSVLDVAITTLPNAPIDSRSGLPIPTMAVSHLDGLTVFKDDGNAYLLSGSNWADITYRVNFDKFGVLYFGQMAYAIIGCDVKGLHQSYTNMVDGRPSYRVGLDDYPFFQAHGENGNGWGASQPFALGSRDDFDLAQWSYYTHPDHRIVRTQMNHDLRDTYRGSSALMNYTGFDFNTGWMHGEIRGAYLSDTSTTAASSTATFTDDFSNSNNWSHADGSAITGGALVLANQSSSRATNLDWGGTTSKRYLLEVDVTSTNGGTCVLDDDGVGAGQGSATNYGTITGSGTYYNYFTKTGSARLRWLRTAGGPITINSMSIHELEDDRSMSDRGLRAYGTITKSAVNTGTDLVGYSGFSSSNYLKGYPDVGSSMTEVSLYGWFKHDGGGSTQEMVRVGNSSSTSHFISLGRITSSADENWRFYYGGNQGSTTINDSDSSAANTWYFLMMTVSPTTIKCYVNAQLVDVRENTYSYLNTGSSPYIQLGNNVQVVTSDNFTASNVRFSESVPTDAQVDKMYNDEKHLYLTNAQATMNGGSGSILLEYDDQTKLLHAGTAAGRSVFQGLRRVEATTDAVTVMISASNGLVVEE